MLAIIGTYPDETFPLTKGKLKLTGNKLEINNHNIEINRGTPALMAAAAACSSDTEAPMAINGFLAGDTGLGKGSEALYEYLVDHIRDMDLNIIVFHYLQPDVDWHNKIMFALMDLKKKPIIIADAGFMYAAKMSGYAPSYDLFTPDAGELAFLADETAPHPFYTRGFILHENNYVPDLISRAYSHDNAARYLLVKGAIDYIADSTGILASVDSPSTEAMEAIGGTGDTLAGITAALIAKGFPIPEAGNLAARANRVAGQMADPDPATGIDEIIRHIPSSLSSCLD